MEKFRFLNWQVYKDAKELFGIILKIVRSLPADVRTSIGSQLTRACFSIILNIAEGSGKNSDKELNRFFDISIGSCYELLASVDTLKDNHLVTDKEFQVVYDRVNEVTKQLGGFKKHIK